MRQEWPSTTSAAVGLDELERLIDERWYAAPAIPADMLRQLPPDALLRRPRLVDALVRISHSVHGDAAGGPVNMGGHVADLGIAFREALDSFDEPDDLLSAGVAAIAGARVRGELAEAEQLGSYVHDRLRRRTNGAAHLSRPGLLSLERAMTYSLQGKEESALPFYVQAVQESGPPPYRHFAGVMAASRLAMSFARSGHHDDARRWSRTARELGEAPEWVRAELTFGTVMAEYWLALDRLDRTEVDAVDERIRPFHSDSDLWPFVAEASLAKTLMWGESAAGLVAMHAMFVSYRTAMRGLAGNILYRYWTDMLTRTGEGNRAMRIIADRTHDPSMQLPTARLHLLTGDVRRARTLAMRSAWDPTIPLRDTIELRIIAVTAAYRMGDTEDALQMLDQALRLRADPEIVQPLATMPKHVREDLLRRSSISLPEEALARLAAVEEPYPEQLALISFTAREQVVLRELASGDPVGEIARRLFVSANTVRSHLKNIYRKLNVTARDDAVARAEELGLLTWTVT